ncbi:MAG: DUF1801 domain-containing protein [Rhodobacteraceae bacterium]|nr:DUF1801 domain-containing protein [Paracoccaceae bacterium]
MARKFNTIDGYISGCNPYVVPLLEELRAFIHATLPGATEDLQYGAPVFINAQGVPVIYLFGSKEYVNFGFLRSAELNDPHSVLKGSGKPSKHIRVLLGEPINKAKLTEFVRQCGSIGLGADSPIGSII